MARLDVMCISDIKLRNEIERVGLFSIEKILLMGNQELMEIGNFSNNDINTLKNIAAKSILPQGFRNVLSVENQLKKKVKHISLDCPLIDQILGGGLPCRGITELSGESGAGKTQFCLQFSITVQYPSEYGGLGRSAVYICTEDKFPSTRLHQLLKSFPREEAAKSSIGTYQFSDNIYVDHIANADALKQCLYHRLPQMLKRIRVGIIIIDSIAAVFRGDYNINESIVRAKDLRDIGLQLHKLSRYFGAAILCVNQVTDALDTGKTLPCLGLAWANLVTTKLQVRLSPCRERTFHIISSPNLPSASIPYKITTSGIVT
ncbi:DNA repair protein XRCC3 [Halyomorpha halys]|uniref:DNA repair protein XRCC3 n=1 Tax=Halyomorpha halys TaxID=286706 RepID=UPI0006D4CCFD|nr:DNA repair protein XRCC3 [Halyomorpha halys]XP_014272372.1 DNA repair protein XRCC3 [Halyomorpha halys]